MLGHRGISLFQISFVPVIFTHSLQEQELTLRARFIRNAVGGPRPNLISVADRELVSFVRIPSFDSECPPQHEIMVGALAVVVPWDDVPVG